MTQQSTEDIIARYLAEYSNVSYWYGGQVLESKFLRIAAATLKAAVILVNPSMKERFEAVDEWVSVVFPPDTDYEIPARDMRRQVESVVDRSARYFKVLSENEEYINIPQDDVNAVLDIVINSLRQSSKKFTPSNVVQKMYAPSEAISLLGSDFDAECDRASILDSARGFGRVVLEACCYQLVSWAQQIPQVQSLAAWTTLANTWALTSATSDIIRELRQTGLAQARDPNRIIASQRRDIANVLGKMELFGLPVEPRYRRIPISVSYVTARGKAATSSQSRIVSFEKLIEDALALRPSFSPGIRLLIIGRAGSGKTTAAQWLAHQAAIGGLGAINAVFRYSIPFFVRLRFTFAKENEASLPADSALLMSGQLREGLGADWIEGLGRDHPPLIVFDGWDELKTNQRNLAGAWLSSLCRRFPYAHIVATSRPEGAGDPVFADEKFTRITLTPLEPERKVLLINQWFDGLKINLEQAPDFDQMNLEDAQRLLIRDVQRPSMMEFTDTPLITSMLCCLYATSRQRNPPSKGALYKTVGTTLIHTRDEDRGVSAGIWDELSYEQKEDLLGEVALKMVEAGILDLPVESIDESFTSVEYIVSDLLPKFGKSSSVSYSLVKNILERSVVLQEVGYRRAEFVHRSFQDYFVGTMLARRWEYEKLFEHVRKDDRLLSLFPFATQAAEQRVADILITWLIDLQIKATGARRKEILFVLIECLASARGLDPQVRRSAISAARAVFPPMDSEEARAMARLGDGAVDFLRVSEVTEGAHEFCIEALARIGTRKAIDALAGYASISGSKDRDFLVAAWEILPGPEYAQSVLSRIPSDLHLIIKTEDRIRDTGLLPMTSSIECTALDVSDTLIEAFATLPRLRELSLVNCEISADLADLQKLRNLLGLKIKDCRLDSVSFLGCSQLKVLELDMVSVRSIDWHAFLGNLFQLEVLHLNHVRVDDRYLSGHSAIPDRAISSVPTLRVLEVRLEGPPPTRERVQHEREGMWSRSHADEGSVYAVLDLSYLDKLPDLRVLRLGDPISPLGLDRICRLDQIRDLDIVLAQDLEYSADIGRLRGLVHLTVSGGNFGLVKDIATLPRLSTLVLKNLTTGRLEQMTFPDRIRHLKFVECDARGQRTEGAAVACTARSLQWYRGFLEDLSFVTRFPNLELLEIQEAGELHDVDDVEDLPGGCRVEMSGFFDEVDDSPIERLRQSGRCIVDYRPQLTWRYEADSGGS